MSARSSLNPVRPRARNAVSATGPHTKSSTRPGASGDDRYSPGRRAELIGPDTASLALDAGQVIFGDPDVRFTDFVGLLLDTVARLRADGSRVVTQ
jgi:hypothetical protein